MEGVEGFGVVDGLVGASVERAVAGGFVADGAVVAVSGATVVGGVGSGASGFGLVGWFVRHVGLRRWVGRVEGSIGVLGAPPCSDHQAEGEHDEGQ